MKSVDVTAIVFDGDSSTTVSTNNEVKERNIIANARAISLASQKHRARHVTSVFHLQRLQVILSQAIPVRWYDYRLPTAYFRLNTALFFPVRHAIMDAAKAEAENIEPSAGKELLDKYWSEAKTEIDDINIVSAVPELAHRAID